MRSSPVCHNLTVFVTEQSLSNNAEALHPHLYLLILHCKMLPTDLKAPTPPIPGNYNHSRTDPRQQTSLVNPKIDPTPEWPTHLIPERPMSLIAQHYTWSAALAFVEKGAFGRSQAILSGFYERNRRRRYFLPTRQMRTATALSWIGYFINGQRYMAHPRSLSKRAVLVCLKGHSSRLYII